jgi:hypothetical protein
MVVARRPRRPLLPRLLVVRRRTWNGGEALLAYHGGGGGDGRRGSGLLPRGRGRIRSRGRLAAGSLVGSRREGMVGPTLIADVVAYGEGADVSSPLRSAPRLAPLRGPAVRGAASTLPLHLRFSTCLKRRHQPVMPGWNPHQCGQVMEASNSVWRRRFITRLHGDASAYKKPLTVWLWKY